MSLTSLIKLCQSNLHSGVLSLIQLVPVHRSLCQSSGIETKTIDCTSIQNPTSLDPIIQLVCEEEDQVLCKRIIKGSSDMERLLVIQFLAFRLRYSDSVRLVLIPFLLENTNLSEELAVTLLELLDGSIDDDENALEEITESLKKENIMTGRILVKLLQGSNSSKTLIKSFHEKLRQTIREAASSLLKDNSLVSSLSKDLLPLLTQQSPDGILVMWNDLHRPHTMRLWEELFSLDYSSNDERQLVLLAITTVLCPLLPHLIECELPFVGAGNDEKVVRRPVEQPKLWSLVYTCLAQGKSLLEGEAATSSILRKRALFLLNILVESNDWKNYVMSFETLEMETEQHLVDQIWDTVDDLLDSVEDSPSQEYGTLTWDWMSLLFSRVLSTDQTVIRKLGLYRLLKIQSEEEAAIASQKRKGKKKTGYLQTRASSIAQKSMHKMPPNFVLYVLLPSWNSLRTSVGYNMHLENVSRKVEKEDMIPLFGNWLQMYLEQLDSSDALLFWKGIWDWSLIQKLNIKNIIIIYTALGAKLSSDRITVPADDESLQSLTTTIQTLFADRTCVLSFRKELLRAVSTMLANCVSLKDKGSWMPMTILNLLTLFSTDYFELGSEDWTIDDEEILKSLGIWIASFEQNAVTIGAAVASAFIGGDLGQAKSRWSPVKGADDTDRDLAWAISLLCSLAAKNSNASTAGQMLWPAINKGLSSSAIAIISQERAGNVARAVLLLENGCKLRQLSGMGNGDLVADRKTQQLMPPPTNIEKMLSNCVDFTLYHIRTLLSTETLSECIENVKPKQILVTYTSLIGQIMTLKQSFPSSNILPQAVETLFKTSHDKLTQNVHNDITCVMLVAMMYASLSAGAKPAPESHFSLCRLLLTTKLSEEVSTWKYASQSTMEYSRWAGISCIIPLLISSLDEAPESKAVEADKLFEDILDAALHAIENTPSYACRPLFDCILLSGRQRILILKGDIDEGEKIYVEILRKTISGLLALMKKSHTSQETMDMLNEICKLIFQPRLLAEEFKRIERDNKCATPIRDTFRTLIKMAGTQRTHIAKAVLCRITVAWQGESEERKSSLGLNAIPYREDIAKLLLHKEAKVDESARNQSDGSNVSGVTEIPIQTNELSISRAFVLVFLSRLPNSSGGLNEKVLKELLHYLILKLLKETAPNKSNAKSLIMRGTPTYCLKMRGWQALCNLSRFVTNDIASEVAAQVFGMMSEHIHGQIRYFVEIFTIQCAQDHPEVFGSAFLHEIGRRDLSLQHISSLMIIGGNWTVGRYKNTFLDPENDTDGRMRHLLASIIPWLSSTQGFSRAIAQLMVHRLTPMVIDVESLDEITPTEEDWFPKVIYRFLEENREMKRLRKKQGSFFERYSVEEMCTPEGVLSIPVDEGDEADPVHMVDAMKSILQGVYAESHDDDIPAWKQVEQLVQSQEGEEVQGNSHSSANFQRKIIPLNSLNLAMEDLREKKLRNAAGQKKQQLIVCASLIDKVPNLGGLARTAEIFAADRLVIPDLAVCKMDNFKSLSVGAGDWIEMEEVRQEVCN